MATRRTSKGQPRQKKAAEPADVVVNVSPASDSTMRPSEIGNGALHISNGASETKNGASSTMELTTATETKNGSSPTFEQIQRRAFELFLARGGTHGGDWDDWFSAEQELTATSSAAH